MVCEKYTKMDIKYNLEKICRVCMSEANDMKAIFDSNENISKILMTCSSIDIAENDVLPQQICLLCIHQANNANLFRQQCERSDSILRNYIKLNQSSINVIKQEQLSNFNEFHDLFQPEITIGENSELNDENSRLIGKNEIKTEIVAGPLCLCGVCGEICEGSALLTQHILQKHTTNSVCHKCPTCQMMFDDANLLQHANICGKYEFSCNQCCESFMQSSLLEKHRETHSADQNYYCRICKCAFTKLSILKKHTNTHHQDQTETICNDNNSDEDKSIMSILQEDARDFEGADTVSSPEPTKPRRGRPKLKRGPEKLGKALETKKESLTFQCTFCLEMFARKLHLKRHMESVHGEKLSSEESYECSDCKKDFPKPELLKRHMKNHAEKKFICDDCPKKFTKLEQLTEHRKRHTGERSYLCSKCGKGYFKQSHLDKHMSTHLNDHLEKPVYECTICGKKLNHSNHLQVHMRTHRDRHGQPLIPQIPNPNKKVILCSVCGKSCSSRSNLAVHMRRHTGQMTNFCKICGKGYPRTTDLTLHMRQHTGEKPFVCSVCNRGFARSDKLAIHMRTHTGEKPYACTMCGRAFAQSNDLASHKRRNMCGQNSAMAQVHNNSNISNVSSLQGANMSQMNHAVRTADLVAANVAQRLDRVADIAAHTRAVEMAAQAAVHHSRIEYTDYTTATLLQNLSSGHFMR